MKKFFNTLFILLFASGLLYAAWTVGVMMDTVKINYRDELSKSQLLNQNTQQQIIELIEENSRLRIELNELKGKITPASTINLEEDKQNVGYQVTEERTGAGESGT